MKRMFSLALLLFVVGVGIVGCGGDDAAAPANPPAGGAAAPAGGADAAKPATDTP